MLLKKTLEAYSVYLEHDTWLIVGIPEVICPVTRPKFFKVEAADPVRGVWLFFVPSAICETLGRLLSNLLVVGKHGGQLIHLLVVELWVFL